MPMPKAQVKGFLDELGKIQGKPVSKALNELLFREPDSPGAGFIDEKNPNKVPPNPLGGADLGSGQSSNVVGSSQVVAPAVGPGGV